MYLYGIERAEDAKGDLFNFRLNCTFMELKEGKKEDSYTSNFRLNCTFMELKVTQGRV